jgi:CDGSH-type Zn-finger protein/uncharacterized Fe-S cluster protein YjdI
MTSASTPPSREQILYWLHEAAEIEHHLMCCYLYAAFSLKRTDPRWTPTQQQAVALWRRNIMSVAYEEMAHLALVGNLASALGAAPHLGRPALPVDAGPYPAGFVIRLAGFSVQTIEHFKFLERPAHESLADAQAFAPTQRYQRGVPPGRLSPGPRDYDTVGGLYQVLADSLRACVQAHGEAAVFVGDRALQVDATLAPLPGVAAVTDLASALAAIQTIVTQGEGAGAEHADSHFSRFSRLGDELAALTAADPSFEPAWPAATNPVMNRPVHSAADRVYIGGDALARWLDIGNAIYTTSLRCLIQGFAATNRDHKATWLNSSFALMRAMVPVGEGLAARPASDAAPTPHAGLTFTPLRTLAALPAAHAAEVVAERLDQLRQRAAELPVVTVAGESAATWAGVVTLLAQQQAAVAGLMDAQGPRPATAPVAAAAPPVSTSSPAMVGAAFAAATAPSPPPTPVEVVRGQHLTVRFDGKRCIHARHCVLDAPTVFKANTPGEWIFPDTVSAEALVGVAHSCPSGAISYQRHDGGAEEAAPAVNQLRIRENGPYAVHAPLTVAGQADGLRATLCRCGQSARKPWCDGAHAAQGFVASGEPPTGTTEPLAQRDGPLHINPLRNGPLHVQGNLEICAGTGRTVARITEARLCRCGQSRHKPFCDASHVAAGFEAPGD